VTKSTVGATETTGTDSSTSRIWMTLPSVSTTDSCSAAAIASSATPRGSQVGVDGCHGNPPSALPALRTPLPTNASRQTLPSDGASEDLPRRFGFRRVPSLLDESTGPLLAGATGGLLAPRLLESSAIAAQK
jgi:hypothetical protein